MPRMTCATLLDSRFLLVALLAGAASSASPGDVVTVPTTNADDLAAALRPIGLKVTSAALRNGADLQFGTYSNFTRSPVIMADGVVMSSGSVVDLSPLLEAQDPAYQPSSPPSRVVNAMNSGTSPEFLSYGQDTGAIFNFETAEDVAVLEVNFELATAINVKFDFVFGSVEFPYWTSQFTDAFLVFLDQRDSAHQISYDPNGAAIQVGQSFANLVTTADRNTAFAAPHGLIVSLTTTTAVLEAGPHTLWFEVGDVNDQVLDSAVFITNLRAEVGEEGTGETNPCHVDLTADDRIDGADIAVLLGAWGASGGSADLNSDDLVDAADLTILLSSWGPCS
jgi:hypothetical protein